MKGKLTQTLLDKLKTTDSGDITLWDDATPGLFVRVKPSGAKSFFYFYYAPGQHRAQRTFPVGRYGVVTLAEAKKKAKVLAAAVANGGDPAKEKAEGRREAREHTVAALFAEYLEYGRAHYKVRTVEFYESLYRLYLSEPLGKLPVKKVRPQDVTKLHHDLRKKPTTANRVVQLVKAFLFWLAKPSQGYVSGPNPAAGIEFYAETERERFLSVAEMARLGQALRVAETIGLAPAPGHKKAPSIKRERNAGMFTSELQPANPFAVAALRFLALTGWREQEALTLKWAEVNLTTGFATLRDSKSGKSVRVLADSAREVLAALPRVKGSPFVFPGRFAEGNQTGKPLREIQRLWYAVRFEAGLEDVRLHDLRHSVASFAGGLGFSTFVVGKLLGHKDTRSTERYAHLSDDIRRMAADDVGEVIREAMAADPNIVLLNPSKKRLPRQP